ncbi:hypothetical protein Tco_1245713 [Tanacetum coccineum]
MRMEQYLTNTDNNLRQDDLECVMCPITSNNLMKKGIETKELPKTAQAVLTKTKRSKELKALCYRLFLDEGYFARECRAPRNQGNTNGDAWYKSRDNHQNDCTEWRPLCIGCSDHALISKIDGYDWSYNSSR